MKKIFTLIVIVALASTAIAQPPCTWAGDEPAPVAVQVSDSCYRIPAGEPSPQFNANGIAEIDNVWQAAASVPIDKHVAGSTPDPNFKAISKFMYDDEWMYILIVVSGDLDIDIVGSPTEQDRVEFMFQNTWGGKGTEAEHCNMTDFAKYYWEQDGDRKFVMPVNRAENLVWLDQDLDDVCGGDDCGEVTGDDWLTYSALNILKYNTYHNADTIIYECAFHLKNWMKYEYTDITELEGHRFGFDFSVRDVDGVAGMTDHINLNDPGNKAFAWTTVLADFVFEEEFHDCDSLDPDSWCVGIKDNTEKVDLSVFPNPVESIVRIETLTSISNVSIVSVTGQLMKYVNGVNINSLTIDLSDLKNGMYFLNITTEDNRFVSKKIIKY